MPRTPKTPRCPRCDARYQRDPSCGKTEHDLLPEDPETQAATEAAARSSALATRRGTAESHHEAADDALALVALLEEQGRTAAADVWREIALEHADLWQDLRGTDLRPEGR